MKYTILGYKFSITESGVFLESKVDLRDTSFLEALEQAKQIQAHGMANKPSLLYMAACDTPGVFKIGVSKNPTQRIKDIFDAREILHTIVIGQNPSAYTYEKAVHVFLREFAVGNERFTLPDEIRFAFCACKNERDLCSFLEVDYQPGFSPYKEVCKNHQFNIEPGYNLNPVSGVIAARNRANRRHSDISLLDFIKNTNLKP